MLAVLMIGVTEATSKTIIERREYRQTEISRRRTGRTGDRTFPVDLSRRERRAAITTRRWRTAIRRAGYTYRDDHVVIFLELLLMAFKFQERVRFEQ